MNSAHMGGLEKQADKPGVKIESLDGDDGIFDPGGDDVIGSKDAQVSARNRQPLDKRNIEVVEFYAAIESGTEGLDAPPLQNRCSAFQNHFTNNQQRDQRDEDCP